MDRNTHFTPRRRPDSIILCHVASRRVGSVNRTLLRTRSDCRRPLPTRFTPLDATRHDGVDAGDVWQCGVVELTTHTDRTITRVADSARHAPVDTHTHTRRQRRRRRRAVAEQIASSTTSLARAAEPADRSPRRRRRATQPGVQLGLVYIVTYTKITSSTSAR